MRPALRDRNAVLLVALAGMAACIDDTPPIVEVFACSDYCPGPEEQYIKRVYEGVTDEDECRGLGGKLYTIEGWGTRVVCEVNEGDRSRPR
jgi:hypothetical protein